MARVLEPQENKQGISDLWVDPKSVFLLVYTGGYCGEFLAWWLGQHPGCLRTQISSVGKNRYIGEHKHNYVLNEAGIKDRLFLTGHRPFKPSKAGTLVFDSHQHIYLTGNPEHHHFFFYLYLIKTMFFRYRASDSLKAYFDDPQQRELFLSQLNGQDTFTGIEIEDWLGNKTTNINDYVIDHWHKSKTQGFALRAVGPTINVSNVFFNDPDAGHEYICNTLGLIVNPKLTYYLPEYHQRNVLLIEQTANMPISDFLSLEDSSLVDLFLSTAHKLVANT